MRNRLILLIYFIINLYTISVVKAGDYHLLPQPQKFIPLSETTSIIDVKFLKELKREVRK